MRNNFLISLMIFPLFIIGCANYQSKTLPSPERTFAGASYSQDEEDVHVAVKFLSPQESKRYFGKKKVGTQFQPTLIAIQNNSREIYHFQKNQLSRPAISADMVAKECQFNTAARATAYAAGALFLWPLAIPAIIDGVGSSNANAKMESDFIMKELQDLDVSPGMTVQGVVFFDPMRQGETLQVKVFSKTGPSPRTFSFTKK